MKVSRPGDIVAMDNPRARKVAGVAEAIRSAEAEVLYLPPCSPDLNPIENLFSKAKGEMRRRKPRTRQECDALRGESLDWFPPPECLDDFRHAGYIPQQRNRKCSKVSGDSYSTIYGTIEQSIDPPRPASVPGTLEAPRCRPLGLRPCRWHAARTSLAIALRPRTVRSNLSLHSVPRTDYVCSSMK